MINVRDLIIGKFYHIKSLTSDSEWYFKLGDIDEEGFYSTGFFIYFNTFETGKYREDYYTDEVFINKNNELNYIYEEIEFCDIMKFLPYNHIERIKYRKERIKILLGC